MARFLQKHNKVILSLVLIALMISITLTGVSSFKAEADPGFDPEIIISHITDTHYYPLSYMYQNNPNNENNNDLMKSQMVDRNLNAEPTFWANLENIMGLDVKPDYLVVSGDISNDGERRSHIEVANGLRSLQNDMRKNGGKPNFQVFVTFGNHDLYNPETYDRSTGTAVKVSGITRKDASIIYSSLGFPEITNEQATEFYTSDEYLGTYTSNGLGFTNSTIASNISITWNYDRLDGSRTDYVQGDLTYLAKVEGTDATFVGLDISLSNKDEGHVLGATLTPHTKAFLEDNKAEYANAYFVGIAHHSLVEHMDYQEEYITGFVIRDWVNVSDFLADYGMRYAFTGHVHSSDISHHISFNNNQITDIETAANLSYASMVRLATITSGIDAEQRRNENLYVENVMLEEVDVTFAYANGYITEDMIQELGLSEYYDLTAGAEKITDFQGLTKNIFVDGILDMVDKYLNPSILGTLKEMLGGVVDGLFNGVLVPITNQLVDVLIEEINTKVLASYEYQGTDPALENNKIFGFLRDMVDKLLSLELSESVGIIDYVMYIYSGQSEGTEASSLEEIPVEIREATANIRSGEVVKELVEILLDKEEGIYFLLKGLLETSIDISSVNGISPIITLLSTMLEYPKSAPLTADNIVLGDVALKLLDSRLGASFGINLDLGGKTIVGFLDAMLEDYLTESLFIGVGEIASNVVNAYIIDTTFDGSTDKTLIKLNDTDTYTYIEGSRTDMPTIENGKLPAKLVVTFGENPATDKNFSWFTDRRVESGVVQYMEGAFVAENATSVTGETVIYGTTMGLIDLGLWSQLGYLEKARHTVSLTGLKPATEYSYRVGNPTRGYWSEVYTFKTAPGVDNAPFEILLITDPQGYTAAAYERVGKLLTAAESVFDEGYSFIISAGDLVEYSKNTTQYSHYFDVLRPYLANTTQVVAAGNHDSNYFEMEDEFEFFKSSENVYVEPYNYMLMNFNFSLPDQDTLTGAYYSYDYSGVHFTVLNTNDSDETGLGLEQLAWLQEDLAASTKTHKVVIMHKSLYSAGPHATDADIIALRAQLGPVFAQGGVNLVISGHDHTYSETFYIDENGEEVTFANNKTTKIGDKGIMYVNLGTVGNKFYKYQETEGVPIYTGADLHDPYLSNPTFGKLTFDGKDLFYQGYEYDTATDTVSEIKAPFRLSTLDIILISTGSAVGAGGISVGIVFLVKFLKKRKLAA